MPARRCSGGGLREDLHRLRNRGATAHDVDLMARTVGCKAQVKASTGIVDLATFEAVVDAGATRVGTSKGIAIVQEAARRSD